MVKVPRNIRSELRIAWVVSVSLGLAIFCTAILTLRGSTLFDDYLFIALTVVLFPPTVLYHLDYRRKKAIDEHLPDLFRSIVQAQQTGMNLPRTLEEAAKRDYGPLSVELKKLVNQMSWGLPFEDALHEFGRRTDTPTVRRIVPLIVEAGRSGGRMEKVFSPIGRFLQTTHEIEEERRVQIRPYIAIIYIAFFVFVFTIVLLFRTFFLEFEGSVITGFSALPSEEAWHIFCHMSLLQGFFGGVVAGKMGSGNITGGFKHSIVLIMTGYLALKFIM